MSEALDAFVQRTDLTKFAPNALAIFALQIRFGIDDPDDLADCITDGDEDKKCDVFYIDEEHGAAVVVQAYESQAPKDNPPLGKVTDLHTAMSWLIDPAAEGANPQMVSAAEQLRAAIEEGEINRIEIWFTHNSPDNPDVDRELQQVAKTASALLTTVYGEAASAIDCVPYQVGVATLDVLYSQRTHPILIETAYEVPTEKWLPQNGPDWRAVYASVPGTWLRALFLENGPDKLFAGNVRDFLGLRRGQSSINRGIASTARNRPGDFWAFNNGVTALVSEISEVDDKLMIRGITIVNGAQTTGALSGEDVSDDLHVLTRFVECTDRALVQEIIRANNTQNEIRASDFQSTDEHQKRLREEFKTLPLAHYTGARRGELVDSAAGADDTHISADLAAQALAAFHGEPQRAYHGKSRIWEEPTVYSRFFSERTSAPHIVYVTSLVRAVHSLKRRLRAKTNRTQADDDALMFISQRGVPFLFAAAIGACQDLILDAGVADSFSLSFGDQVSPAVAEELWRPVVESLIAFHPQLQEAAESGKIRSPDARAAAMTSFKASIHALRQPLDDSVFSKFRPHVVVAQA